MKIHSVFTVQNFGSNRSGLGTKSFKKDFTKISNLNLLELGLGSQIGLGTKKTNYFRRRMIENASFYTINCKLMKTRWYADHGIQSPAVK